MIANHSNIQLLKSLMIECFDETLILNRDKDQFLNNI